ncbi:hypothetical protein HMPREF2883_00170 [Actinomyces sp. HMSC075C01]|uniref:Uncharacterized protein n=1 Tax=Actinomyces oris TaxID=544580 RepID=A0A1Q8VV94_9ACTO|nr:MULTISPECIES: hypothetical protein [Actinomyces]OFR60091.1 hypothetical protein HMPREF2883_00170 [Actinomyces sp. HMSC075C01]OLO52025.1 hypothetical protein BKH27_10405 [Actinomyces oris]
MPIDTHLDATPADITASALDVGKVKTAVDEAEIDVSRANRTMQSGELEGETAKQVKKAVGLKLQQCRTLSSSLGSYKTALENFASGLTTVKSDLAGVREKAVAGGLTVEGEKVMEPQAPPPLMENNPVERDKDRQTHQTLVDNYNTKNALYKTLSTETSDIRIKETEARDAFANACSAIIDNPVWKELKGALLPDTSAGGAVAVGKTAIWANSMVQHAARLAEGVGLKATNAVVKHPMRDKPHKWVTSHDPRRGTPKGMKPRWVRNDRHLSNWEVPEGKSGTWGGKTVAAARKAAPYLEKVDKGFVAVDFAVSGYEQWQKDSHNPSLSEGKKAARATTTGTGSAVGGCAGAKLGATIGASFGVAGGPIGVAVGGVAGGIIGGVAGSWLGKTGANWFNNTFLK